VGVNGRQKQQHQHQLFVHEPSILFDPDPTAHCAPSAAPVEKNLTSEFI
jgi:hypothetical protein